MTQAVCDILEVLKSELRFLEDGGYGQPRHAPWRAAAIFEDSPICLNFCDPTWPHPCQSCPLEQFVPEDQRYEKVPCRFIQLAETGETVEDLYRTGSKIEMEEALEHWLRVQIETIEQERGQTDQRDAA